MGTWSRSVFGAAGGVVAVVVVLTACGAGSGAAQVAPASDAARVTTSAPATGATPSTATAGRFVDLATYRADPAAYSSGRVVLFFHATWCPNCRLTEKNLTQDPGSIPADLTIVKVDFDTETDLRKQYGITQQHTFVAVGPDGTEKATWTGTYTAAEISGKAG